MGIRITLSSERAFTNYFFGGENKDQLVKMIMESKDENDFIDRLPFQSYHVSYQKAARRIYKEYTLAKKDSGVR